jgi:hypothetical protein
LYSERRLQIFSVSLEAIGAYSIYTNAEPNPNSAKLSTLNIDVKILLRPRYESPKKVTKSVLIMKGII